MVIYESKGIAMYFLAKTVISALIIVGISELAKRNILWAALLASLPLTSILAFTWVYIEQQDTTPIMELSYSVFWLVLPSLIFFLALPFLLEQGLHFGWAMLLSTGLMALLYGAGLWLHRLFGYAQT